MSRVVQEFYCTKSGGGCGGYFMIKMNMGLNGVHKIICPNCKLYGSFPHHNPKVGSHETVEELTLEDFQAIKENRFDRKAFDNRIIERHKRYWPHLWAYNENLPGSNISLSANSPRNEGNDLH